MIFRFHVSWLGLSTFICAMFMAISNTIRETSTSTTVFFWAGVRLLAYSGQVDLILELVRETLDTWIRCHLNGFFWFW